MTISFRFYILQDDGALRRVARRVVEGLTFGADAIPEYAGTRQRSIQVLVELEDGRPLRILDVTGSFWTFDEAGKIDTSLRRETGEWLDHAFSSQSRIPRGRVVDLVPELKRREVEARHRWTVNQADVDRIAADLWPGVHGPAPDITAVKGKAPRRPPLTWEAKRALEVIGTAATTIDDALGELTEAALRGVIFEAERHATYEDEGLWLGVAAHARHHRAIKAAWRTGRGDWYAALTVFKRIGQDAERMLAQAHAKASSQTEAVEAGRRLMAEKANWFGPEYRLHLVVYSALEWQPEEDG